MSPPVSSRDGERLAAFHYRLRGHRVLARDVRTPVAQVDLVCRRGATLVVVEVKRRRRAPDGVVWIGDVQVDRLHAAAAWLRRRHPWARTVRVELLAIEGWRVRVRERL